MPYKVMVVAPNPADFYFQEIFIGVHEFANQRPDWKILRHRDAAMLKWDEAILDRPDGILGILENARQVTKKKLGGIKTVVINNTVEHHPFPRVNNDDIAVGKKAALHLLGRRLVHFAYAGSNQAFHSRLTLQGFRQTLEEAGHQQIPVYNSNVYLHQKDDFVEWLGSLPRPCGILCVDDMAGCRAVKYTVESGYKVPDDFAYMGITNREFSCVQAPVPLTSVKLNLRELGFKAAAQMHEILTGKNPLPFNGLVNPGEVIYRESTNIVALKDPTIRRALTLIEQHFQEDLNVESLLKLMGTVSRRHLETKFREILGATPREEILHCRMRHAQRLVLNTDKTIEAIGCESGYTDLGHFSRQFKSVFGLSPAKYRRYSIHEQKS